MSSYTRVNWQNSPNTATPLSAENLNKMDAGIKKNADDIEQLQQHTYDDELDSTSTNAPQTKAVYEAMQRINVETDPTLSVSGKAADAAATGEAIADVKTAIRACLITDTATGAIASFPDGAAMPVESLTVELEPIQDLHGQSNPYPAGGGKNKLAISSSFVDVETRGVSFTVNRNDAGDVLSIVCNGTATARVYCSLGRYDFKAGTILSGCPADGSTNSYQLVVDGTPIADRGSGYTITEDVTNGNLMVVIASGYVCNNLTFKPMVRDASVTDATFAPYSNICPITGRDSVTVTRTGKNLFDKDNPLVKNGYIDPITQKIVSSSSHKLIYIPCKPNTAYTASKAAVNSGSADRLYIGWTKTVPAANVDAYDIHGTSSGFVVGTRYSFTTQTGADAQYVVVWISRSGEYADSIATAQIEVGSTVSAYEPYDAQSVTIQLGTTVYGGTVDVTTGVMTVDRAMVDLGTLNWANSGGNKLFYTGDIASEIRKSTSNVEVFSWGITSIGLDGKSYNSITQNTPYSICVSMSGSILATLETGQAYSNANAFKAAMSGVQLCYELAAPLEITIDPATLSTLKGQNNVWSDADSVTVEYVADPKLYITKVVSQ